MTAMLERPAETISVECGWGYEEITPGVIDRSAEYAFTNGQCHALAIALHEETGWPMVQVGIGRNMEGVPSHWMVETPSGDLLDIGGLATPEDVEWRWGRTGPGSVGEAWGLYSRGVYREPDVEAARHFVAPVLALVSEAVAA